ncbi:MAG: zinc ribbon domain-containing protein [Gemmatimonadales bacterium]
MTPLARLVSRLVHTVRERDPSGLHRPIAIGELRRAVLPYRTARNVLGLESIEDYELLILRLVAEEDGWARTFPPEAAERCRDELLGANPDLEIVEDLDEVTVQLGAGAVAKVADLAAAAPPREKDALPFIDTSKPASAEAPAKEPAAPAPPPEPPSAEAPSPTPKQPEPDPDESYVLPLDPLLKRTRAGSPSKPAAGPAAPPPSKPAPPRPSAPVRPIDRGAAPRPPAAPPSQPVRPVDRPPVEKARAAGSAEPASKCVHCGSTLPLGKRVAFCPFCGQQLLAIRCPGCGTEIEPGWRHCISCGHSPGSGRVDV